MKSIILLFSTLFLLSSCSSSKIVENASFQYNYFIGGRENNLGFQYKLQVDSNVTVDSMKINDIKVNFYHSFNSNQKTIMEGEVLNSHKSEFYNLLETSPKSGRFTFYLKGKEFNVNIRMTKNSKKKRF